MIYVIRAKDSDFVKIGYTSSNISLKKRIKSLQTSNPLKLILEAKMKGSKLKEKCLHSFCISRHKSGEWFKLNVDEVNRMVIKYCNWTPTKDGIIEMPQLKHQLEGKYFK